MLDISLGVALFTAIITVLVLVILGIRAKLVPSGEITITVNGSRQVSAPAGAKLLVVLSAAGIQLPSACAGGICGQCRIKVIHGGGGMLATEKPHFSRREIAQGERLACQVTVKQDMAVEVPEEIFGVRQWQCTVRSNDSVATLIKELVLTLAEGDSIEFRAGNYVQVTCPPYRIQFREFKVGDDYRPEWERFDLWRYEMSSHQVVSRAYSMANAPQENKLIRLDVRLAIPPPGAPDSIPPGVVSSYLFGVKPGDKVMVSGPFGHFVAQDSDREMIFVGGGVGMAPMRALILDQLLGLKTERTITFWYGARNVRELLYRDLFDQLQKDHNNFNWYVVLSEPSPEDQWRGMTGFIHEALLEHYLDTHPAPEECEYYLCGPPMMIKAVRNMLDSLGVDPESIFFDDFGG